MAMLITERCLKARLDYHKRLLDRHTQQGLKALSSGRSQLGKRYINLTHHDVAMVREYEKRLREFQRGDDATP